MQHNLYIVSGVYVLMPNTLVPDTPDTVLTISMPLRGPASHWGNIAYASGANQVGHAQEEPASLEERSSPSGGHQFLVCTAANLVCILRIPHPRVP